MNEQAYCDNPVLWEEIYSSIPSRAGLYFHELIMLKYVGYDNYYSDENKYPSIHQMSVLYPDELMNSLIERGYIAEDDLYNTILSRSDVMSKLLQEKGFSPEGVKKSKDEKMEIICDNYSEKELLQLVPFRKYSLTSTGKNALSEFKDCEAFSPYSGKNPFRRFYTSSAQRYVKPKINFYCVDIVYNSAYDEFYFNHTTKRKGNIQDLNLNFLYLVVPKDITGPYADGYEKAAIKAHPTTFRFFYDNVEIYKNSNIESIFAVNKKSTKIIFSKFKRKETKRTRIKNPEGIPDRIVIEDINYYDYFSFDFKNGQLSFIETLTDKLNLSDLGNSSLQSYISNFIADTLKKFSVPETHTISFSVSNYLGELIVKNYLGNKYTVVEIEGDWCPNDVKNYKILIPQNDVKGLAFIWFLRSRELIGNPNCLDSSVADVLNKLGHVLYKNNYFHNDYRKVVEAVLYEHKRTLDIALTAQEELFLQKCNNNAVLAAETIVSNFGERWLAGDYINPEKGLINELNYEKILPDCRQMYNEALLILQQEGFYVPKWKQEFQLFLLLSSYYPDAFFQYRSKWLGLQSLDVFLPTLNIAFEYQGVQHFKPVDFFGGEENFQETVERDMRKKQLCEKNNIRLIYWVYSEDITSNILRTKLDSVGVSLPDKKTSPDIILTVPPKKRTTKTQNSTPNNNELKIFQYDKNLNLVGTFSTIAEASRSANISDTSIGKAINGDRFLAGGYFWYRGVMPLKEFPQKWHSYLEERNLI